MNVRVPEMSDYRIVRKDPVGRHAEQWEAAVTSEPLIPYLEYWKRLLVSLKVSAEKYAGSVACPTDAGEVTEMYVNPEGRRRASAYWSASYPAFGSADYWTFIRD